MVFDSAQYLIILPAIIFLTLNYVFQVEELLNIYILAVINIFIGILLGLYWSVLKCDTKLPSSKQSLCISSIKLLIVLIIFNGICELLLPNQVVIYVQVINIVSSISCAILSFMIWKKVYNIFLNILHIISDISNKN